jgi:translation initiation factor 2-alpha kinase 3
LDANNNTKSTTKSSLSSSSPLFDHSSDSSNEKNPLNKEITESDDGIIFLHDEKPSSSSSPIQSQTKSLNEKRKSLASEKDIPPIYFYFVMELCQAESLRDRLIQRMIDRHQAWSIFDQIIKGIEYIHSQKLIHRDLKPSNILFSMDNTVKIGDFGLVSAFGEDKLAKKKKRDDEKFDQIETTSSTTDACGNNELGGTILYMSPEQVK